MNTFYIVRHGETENNRASWSGATNTFSGTPSAGLEGTYNFTITAKNGTATVTQSFVLVVT